MTSELKTCPFCGLGPNRVVHNDNTDWWQYECSADGIINTCPVNPVGHIYDTQHEAEAAWNTRAVPDAPDLVRYSVRLDEGRYFGMAEYAGGKYVLHSQAAEIIAAKDAEIALKDTGLKIAMTKIAALEANLAQYEVQEPADGFVIEDGISYAHKVFGEGYFFSDDCLRPFYTAPVASDADLRVENERLREALENANGLINTPVARRRYAGDQFYIEVIRSIEAALNPSEPQT
ncbi:hypothetical protein [Pseudochrobactrum sp. MP213Fo]|uniref:hypothetical protein n=1 Tax=Pseudochrobactrum sp. MP213Fo TaxID=3022250 RepID=UPI003BA3BAD9